MGLPLDVSGSALRPCASWDRIKKKARDRSMLFSIFLIRMSVCQTVFFQQICRQMWTWKGAIWRRVWQRILRGCSCHGVTAATAVATTAKVKAGAAAAGAQ